MSGRKMLDLGLCGRIPVDTLHEMYLDMADGECLTLYQSKTARSLGSWVYNGAACLAKYLETEHFKEQCSDAGDLSGKRLIELGAGTGVVGLLASHYGADSVMTDMESLVPLINFNIQENKGLLKGAAVGKTLCWGNTTDTEGLQPPPDFLVLANCVYYEGSLEVLSQTVEELSDRETLVLACYEERSPAIKTLIQKWHTTIGEKFAITDVPIKKLALENVENFVRIVLMRRKN